VLLLHPPCQSKTSAITFLKKKKISFRLFSAVFLGKIIYFKKITRLLIFIPGGLEIAFNLNVTVI
jgi:hypothetical protein